MTFHATLSARLSPFRSPGLGSAILAGMVLLASSSAVSAQWPQWGGPHRNFISDSTDLADAWPEDGPKKLWNHAVGDGFSGIVSNGDHVFTQYRSEDDQHEIVVALDAETGKEAWSYRYEAPLPEEATTRFGKGPNATPLLSNGALYTIGFSAKLACLDAKTGKERWTKDLWKEFEGTFLNFGYSASPLAYKDNLIVLLGGENNAILSLKLKDGSVNWKSHSYLNSYASPILIDVDGQDQLVAFMGTQIVGILPESGQQTWSFPHENQWKTNICTPLWGKDQLLYFGSGGEAGSRVLKLQLEDEKTEVTEVWESSRVKMGHTNAVRVGETVYGTSGDGAVQFLTAMDVTNGSLRWRKRGFTKTNMLFADGKLLMLDEDGNLILALPTDEGVEILAKTKVLEKVAWTLPTLVGNRLFVRDRKSIVAFELPRRS